MWLTDKNESMKIHAGDRFTFKGFEWVVLDPDKEGGVLAVMADIWKEDARFSVDFSDRESDASNWFKSNARDVLYKELYPVLGDENLILHTVDLIADDGSTFYGRAKEKVFMLTCDEFRRYRKIIPAYSGRVWTCTPMNTNEDDTFANSVRYVNPDKTFADSYAITNYNIVPACIFNPAHLSIDDFKGARKINAMLRGVLESKEGI